MNQYLENSVKLALDNGIALVPIEPRGKSWLDLDAIENIEEWERRKAVYSPDINAAIFLNYSNLCVIDIDGPQGFQTLRKHCHLPRTTTVKTARGLHLYYWRGPWIGDSGHIWIGEHHIGEFLCGNLLSHYSLLPGSIHPSGIMYRWWGNTPPMIANLNPLIYNWIACDILPYDDFQDYD